MKKRKNFIAKDYLPLVLLLVLMLLIHRYIFLYGDDYYYARDAKLGIGYLKELMAIELRSNGRTWVHLLLTLVLKWDIHLFRIINPFFITLGALLISRIALYISGEDSKNPSESETTSETFEKRRIISVILSIMFFLFLPVKITSTTLYYASCTFNYLYPPLLALYFGVRLHRFIKHELEGKRVTSEFILILFLALLTGSSTQQCSMIGLGFITIFYLNIRLNLKVKPSKKYLLIFLTWLLGFIPVFYGSVSRFNNERIAADGDIRGKIVTENIFTNLIRPEVFIFVLVTLLSNLMYFRYLKYCEKNRGIEKILPFPLNTMIHVQSAGIILYILCFLTMVFMFPSVMLFKTVFLTSFFIFYIFSLTAVSVAEFRKTGNPFLFAIVINLSGAQIMMFITHSSYGENYKTVFPTLLLTFIYFTHNFLKGFEIRKNRIIANLVLVIMFSSSLINFGFTFNGYRRIATFFEENIKFTKDYRNGREEAPDKKDELVLNFVPGEEFGFYTFIWNELPPHFKEYYGIEETHKIGYSYFMYLKYYIKMAERFSPILRYVLKGKPGVTVY